MTALRERNGPTDRPWLEARNPSEHGRPYFLLLPSYVINKLYYIDALLTGGRKDGGGGGAAAAAEAAAETDEDSDGDEDTMATRIAVTTAAEAMTRTGRRRTQGRRRLGKMAMTTTRRRIKSEEVVFKVHENAAAAAGVSTMKKKNGKFIVPAHKKRRIPSLESAANQNSRKQTLPFYVAPVKRYYYWTPKALIGARREAAGTLDTESAKLAERSTTSNR